MKAHPVTPFCTQHCNFVKGTVALEIRGSGGM